MQGSVTHFFVAIVLYMCITAHCLAQVQTTRTAENDKKLAEKLITLYELLVKNATGLKSYVMIKKHEGQPRPEWQVGAMDKCQIEVAPGKAIGHALICPEESPSPCQFTAKFVDIQSTTNELGFKSEFSLSAKGGVPGALEFEAKVTLSEERRFSRQFNEGKELTYTFHVEKGKACRLSQVSYRARCQGVLYEVPLSCQTVLCPVLVRLDRQFSFNEPHAWFKDPEYPDWFHRVRKVNEFMDPVPSGLYLWSFRVKNPFPPTSCADLIQDAEYRPMTEKTRDPNSESFLMLDNGKSISAVSCIYYN